MDILLGVYGDRVPIDGYLTCSIYREIGFL